MASVKAYQSVLKTLRLEQPEDYSYKIDIPTGRVMVLSDVHIPYCDDDMLGQALHRAKQEQVETVVFLGDLMDMPTYSFYGNENLNTQFGKELTHTKMLVNMFASYFNIYWSRGNHEERFLRKNSYQMTMEDLANLVGLGDLVQSGRLVTSDNPTLYAHNREWMLFHPDQYGASPLVVPGRLADKFQCNVMSGHAHHWAMGTNSTGKFTVVETGGMFNQDLVPWINYKQRTNREWVAGYWILYEDGTVRGFRN